MTDSDNFEDFYTGVLQGSATFGVGDVLDNPIPLRDGQPYPYLRRLVKGGLDWETAYYGRVGDFRPGTPQIYRYIGSNVMGTKHDFYKDSYEV